MRSKVCLTTGREFGTEQVPVSDEVTTNWSEYGGNGVFWDEVNEGRPGDDGAGYCWSSSNNELKFKLSSRGTPGDRTQMRVTVRLAVDSDAQQVALTIYSPVAVLRWTDAVAHNVAEGWHSHTFAPVDLSAITDWTDVYMRVYNVNAGQNVHVSMLSLWEQL